MKQRVLSLVLPLMCLLFQGATSTSLWSPDAAFPSPQTHPKECGSATRLCDPDDILSDNDKESLLEAIAAFEDSHFLPCTNDADGADQQRQHDVQLAVALVERMDLNNYQHYNDAEERAVQDFAVTLHNTWGVGVDSPCGGTGILIMLSIHDRAIYISTGDAVVPFLTEHRLEKVIEKMKSPLRRVKYGKALETAVHEIARAVESGEPQRMEQVWILLENLLHVFFWVGLICMAAIHGWLQQRRQRQYARVQTQLSELDRNRAEALQGRYQCTSCPICFEDYQTSCEEEQSDTLVGSDGLPLMLLRCGHVFDQTCWNEWMEKGEGNVSKCPICNEDVGGVPSEQVSASQQGNEAIRQRGGGGLVQEHRALRRYNEERMFRLARLGMRYPRFVNHNQVQRWSDPAYDRSLARDSSFTRNNPAQNVRYSSGGNSGLRSSSRSFGGGRSSGGFSGRW